MKDGCLYCKKHAPGCHSDCPVYNEFKEKLKERNKTIRDAKKAQQALDAIEIERRRGKSGQR